MNFIKTRGVRRRDPDEAAENGGAGKCSQHPADGDEQRVLDEELADQTPAAAANRGADTELVLA